MNVRTVRVAASTAVLAVAVGCGGGGGPTQPPPAQTGTVSGTVTANGSGVADVQIALPGKPSQTTAANGSFSFTQVTAGNHTLTMTLPEGYELDAGETLAKQVQVSANQTATVGWVLRAEVPTTVTTDTVRLSGTSFIPSTLTVKVGSTVVWVNEQSTAHTVTPDGHTQWARAETSAPGEVLRATINAAGEFDYYCEPHQSMGMTGTIVVQP